MKFGLTDDEFKTVEHLVLKPIKKLGGELYCYGSRARGDFKKFSDLDLMIESPTDLSTEIAEIKEALTQSNFPYKIDLVQFKDFAAAYVEGYQKEKIEL